MISIRDLSVKYSNTEVLRDFSLDLQQGDIYTLIGPSGCGKSTLLKVLSGIKKDYQGVLEYNGKAIHDQNISIGYVPQNYGLLEWKTVEKNILLPLLLDRKKQFREDEYLDIIQSLEIESLLKRYPSELSGGQKQRVALARAFLSQPNILLMDEPFSSLDAFTSNASQELFLRLWSKYKVTTLFITHNIHEAVAVGKHILLMSKSEKRIMKSVVNTTFGNSSDTDRLLLSEKILGMFKEVV